MFTEPQRPYILVAMFTPTIVRIFTNFTVTNSSELLGRSEAEFEKMGVQIQFNRSGKADLVLVLNMVTTPRWVRVPKGNIIKVLQEPLIRNPVSHLFTYWHSRVYDQILTHSPDVRDTRQIKSLPLTGSFVDPTSIANQPFDEKKHSLSIVASTLAKFPGHKLRFRFINDLLTSVPELSSHIYGKGRQKELQNKIDGLREYRYSIAIENSCIPSYITEKFYDCVISGCVPVYYGAPNVADYFPAESYVSLPINDFDKCLQIIRGLSVEDFERRIPALIEARSLIRDKYSLGAVILDHLELIQNRHSQKKRTVFLLRLDGIIVLVQKIGITTVPKRILARILSSHHAKKVD